MRLDCLQSGRVARGKLARILNTHNSRDLPMSFIAPMSAVQSAFIESEREHARIHAVGLESYYAAVVAGLSDDDCERAFALACDSERAPAPTPTIRAYIVGEGEDTAYVCPACHAAHHHSDGWAVTTEEGLEIPACDECGVTIDGTVS